MRRYALRLSVSVSVCVYRSQVGVLSKSLDASSWFVFDKALSFDVYELFYIVL